MAQSKMWKRIVTFAIAFMLVFASAAAPCNTVDAASKTAVKSVKLKVGSKTVTKKTYKVYSGDKKTLKVTVSPSAAKKSVKFSSNKKSVATVSTKGVIRAKKSGTAKITVKVTGKNKKTKTTYVKVKVSYVKLSLNKKSLSLETGKSQTLKATVSPSRTVKWSSSNKSVATVSSKGKVKGVKAGTATITAKVGNKKVTCKVTVADPASTTAAPTTTTTTTAPTTTAPAKVEVTGVSLDKSQLAMVAGDTQQLTATVSPADATDKTVTWKSSDESAVTVSQSGLVTAKAATTGATITATAGGKSASCKVTVAAKKIEVTKIEAAVDKNEIKVGDVAQITASARPEDATDKELTYSSSDESIATVNGAGAVIGVAPGTATITIKASNGVKAEITITVEQALEDDVTLEVTNPVKDNEGKAVENTVLAGTDMNVRARVINNHKPVANANISLKMKRIDADAEGDYELKNDSVTTDSDGYANFTVGVVKGEENTVKATKSGYDQSFRITATVPSTSQTKDLEIKFATVELPGIELVNSKNLEPGVNAKLSNLYGLEETASVNNTKNNIEFVSSQQVSTSSKDHSLQFNAQPMLVAAAAKGSVVERQDWSKTFESPAGVSGTYSIYNTKENTTTTTVVEDVPSGLQYLTVIFDKISLSPYTKLYVDFYNDDDGLTRVKEISSDQNTDLLSGKNSIQIPEGVVAEGGRLIVSVVSEGFVDASNEGYILKEITGPYALTSDQEAIYKEIGTVQWSIVDDQNKLNVEKYTVDNANVKEFAEKYLTEADYEKYIEEDENAAISYTVPSFPHAGNALITVKDGNGNTKAIFAYPSVAEIETDYYGAVNSNKNVIKEPDGSEKAYLISEEEATQLAGSLKTENNYAYVDSTKTGSTLLKAVVTVDELSAEELNSQNGGELYTFVQWSPVPKEEAEDTTPKYYAIEDQTVTVTAQLFDTNNNVATMSNETINFKYSGGTIDGLGYEITDEEYDATARVTVFDANTNSKGQAQIVIQGSAMANIEGLQATTNNNNYNVKFAVGTDYVTRANLYWVDLGLKFKKEANNNSYDYVYSWDTDVDPSDLEIDSQVGKVWHVGYLPVARAANTVGTGYDINVTALPIKYSSGSGSVGEVKQLNDTVASVSSTKLGTTSVIGQFDTAKIDTSKVTFSVPSLKDYEPVYTDYTNIGSGSITAAEDETMTAKINWNQAKGENAEIIVPTASSSNIVNADQESCIYVKVVDDYGNAIQGAKVALAISGPFDNLTARLNGAVIDFDANGSYKTDEDLVTDSNGICKLQLPNLVNPGEGLQATMQGGEKEPCNINIRVDNSVSKNMDLVYQALANTSASKDTLIVAKDKQIEITFDKKINASSVNKSMFVLNKDLQDLGYKVASASLDSDQMVITLTLNKNLTSDYEGSGKDLLSIQGVAINGYGIIYYLLDTQGYAIYGDLNSVQ